MAYQDALLALADPTRRSILQRLRRGPLAVGKIAAHLPVSRPAVSQHLRVLLDAGLVRERRDGRERRYRLDPGRLTVVRDWLVNLERFWRQRLHALGDYLDEQEPR